MSKAKRLASIVRLAELREQQSLSLLQQALQHEQQQTQALENIKNYQADYYRQREAELGQQLPSTLLSNFTKFVQDLDTIAAMQVNKVSEAKDKHQQAIDSWTEKYRRRQTLNELAQQAVHEERKLIEQKIEREQEDNWVSRRQNKT